MALLNILWKREIFLNFIWNRGWRESGKIRHFMGSFKFQGRTHRERAQPSSRAKLGLLEKHADYQERAKNSNLKKTRLKALKKQALVRNPDEFYFAMENTKFVDGSQRSTKPKNVLHDEVLKILKMQDVKYLEILKNQNIKKLQELTRPITEFTGNHVRFFDGEDEKEKLKKKISKQEKIQKKIEKENKEKIQNSIKETESSDSKTESNILKEIDIRKKRIKVLQIAQKELQLHRDLMSKGKRRKVGIDDDGIPIYKWERERKK